MTSPARLLRDSLLEHVSQLMSPLPSPSHLDERVLFSS
jgi:hypothetical protein